MALFPQSSGQTPKVLQRKSILRKRDPQNIQSLLVEDLDKAEHLERPVGAGLDFFDTESHLQKLKWAQDRPPVQTYKEILEAAEEEGGIRTIRSQPRNPADLLQRGLNINRKHLIPIKFQVPADKLAHFDWFSSSLNLDERLEELEQATGEELAMADPPFSDPEKELSQEEEEQEDGASNQTSAAPSRVASPIPPIPTVAQPPRSEPPPDHNRALDLFHDVTPRSPYGPGGSALPPLSYRMPTEGLPQLTQEPIMLSPPIHMRRSKVLDRDRPSSYEEHQTELTKKMTLIAETTNLLFTDVSSIQDTLVGLTDLLKGLSTAVSGLERRMQNLESTALMLSTGIARVESQLRNMAVGQQPVTLATQPTSSVMQPPPLEEARATISPAEQEIINSARRFYRVGLAPLKLEGITEDLYITIQRMGGFLRYAEKVYPENKEGIAHMQAIDEGSKDPQEYQLVGRLLARLASRLHKTEYLPSSGRLPAYEGALSRGLEPMPSATRTLPATLDTLAAIRARSQNKKILD